MSYMPIAAVFALILAFPTGAHARSQGTAAGTSMNYYDVAAETFRNAGPTHLADVEGDWALIGAGYRHGLPAIFAGRRADPAGLIGGGHLPRLLFTLSFKANDSWFDPPRSAVAVENRIRPIVIPKRRITNECEIKDKSFVCFDYGNFGTFACGATNRSGLVCHISGVSASDQYFVFARPSNLAPRR